MGVRADVVAVISPTTVAGNIILQAQQTAVTPGQFGLYAESFLQSQGTVINHNLRKIALKPERIAIRAEMAQRGPLIRNQRLVVVVRGQ